MVDHSNNNKEKQTTKQQDQSSNNNNNNNNNNNKNTILSTFEPTSSEEEKYCKLVQSNPQAFNDWTSLISIVEKRPVDDGTINNLRSVYNDFLSEFPLCFLYWKRFADHEYATDNHIGAIDIYERAIKAVSYSVDIWINYTTHLVSKSYPSQTVRDVFSKGASTIGTDFQSSKFWDKYIDFELSQEQVDYNQLGDIFNTILKTPIDNFQPFYERFKDLIDSFSVEDLITPEEKHSNDDKKTILENRDKWYHQTLDEINKRLSYEWIVGKRFFFHIQPVDEQTLSTWRLYLDYIEKTQSSNTDNVIGKLYERCLIPCCYYPEFWIRYTRYLESIEHVEQVQRVYERATGIFLKKRPDVHLEYSMFLESQGKVQESANVLENIAQQCPHHVETIVRLAAFKKRHAQDPNDLTAVDEFYSANLQSLLDSNDSALIKASYPFLVSHYSRFLARAMNQLDRARKVLSDAIDRYPSDSNHLYLSAIQLEMTSSSNTVSNPNIIDLYEKAITNLSATETATDKQEIWNHYLEFTLDWVNDINVFRELSKRYRKEFPDGKPESKKRLYSDSMVANNGSVATISGNASPIGAGSSGSSSGVPTDSNKRVAYSNPNNTPTNIIPPTQNPYYQQQQYQQQQQQPYQQPYQQQQSYQQQQQYQQQQYQQGGYNGGYY
ncbi:hypothetical protein CYY_005750 [Polysphondylium violaceum]|uniref:Suppressor of forked domain-containing protein n=1 Tax=Polysphondylium violaceum TaxID=133409 RepID=A0A8J4UZF3_9MYCE|nr:hypothetical protein CYY_005750 [Polysphondylium violaceum]